MPEKHTIKVITYAEHSFASLLTLLFIALKLLDKIDWAWGWVLAPLWIPWALVLGFVAVLLLIVGLLVPIDFIRRVRRRRRIARVVRERAFDAAQTTKWSKN